jgi:hypothetical protein
MVAPITCNVSRGMDVAGKDFCNPKWKPSKVTTSALHTYLQIGP